MPWVANSLTELIGCDIHIRPLSLVLQQTKRGIADSIVYHHIIRITYVHFSLLKLYYIYYICKILYSYVLFPHVYHPTT